jgi:transcriptional regulator with XRE-family HTH domain
MKYYENISIALHGHLAYHKRTARRKEGVGMTFAEKLRQLRYAAELTQEQLAERSGINLWTIRGYEQGRREPNWKGVLCLAKALHVTAEVFADCEESDSNEELSRPRGRPKKAEGDEGDADALPRAEDMPPAQRKPKRRKARRPRGG